MSWKLTTNDPAKLRPIFQDMRDDYGIIGRLCVGYHPYQDESGNMVPAIVWEDDADSCDTPTIVEARATA